MTGANGIYEGTMAVSWQESGEEPLTGFIWSSLTSSIFHWNISGQPTELFEGRGSARVIRRQTNIISSKSLSILQQVDTKYEGALRDE